MGRQINDVDVIDIGLVHIFGRDVATVTVNNEEALLVRGGRLNQGYKHVLQPFKPSFVIGPALWRCCKLPILERP